MIQVSDSPFSIWQIIAGIVVILALAGVGLLSLFRLVKPKDVANLADLIDAATWRGEATELLKSLQSLAEQQAEVLASATASLQALSFKLDAVQKNLDQGVPCK